LLIVVWIKSSIVTGVVAILSVNEKVMTFAVVLSIVSLVVGMIFLRARRLLLAFVCAGLPAVATFSLLAIAVALNR
jgi:hypothetical protein